MFTFVDSKIRLMKKIITVIGARPQIIKSAAFSRTVRKAFSNELTEVIVHTGQHYDENMSAVFFDEMEIPKPHYNLEVGSGSHGAQTASMIEKLEEILLKEKPEGILVYGDTNSTLAAAVAASKIHIPIIHVEAGLRSFNKSMPEEVNRIVCDHLSTLLFSPTSTGYQNLINEGFSENKSECSVDAPNIYHCGDIMYDNTSYFTAVALEKNTVLEEIKLTETPFFLTTIHRGANTDDEKNLTSIFSALLNVLEEYSSHHLVLPLHPRTRKCMEENVKAEIKEQIESNTRLHLIDPVSYLNILALENKCDLVITDSGGLQKEAYFNEKPCVILRPETEWVEIVDNGNAIIANADENAIFDAVKKLMDSRQKLTYPSLYGDGEAASFISNEIIRNL
jgi:UDP-GlcNAc3NAcA epimerase